MLYQYPPYIHSAFLKNRTFYFALKGQTKTHLRLREHIRDKGKGRTAFYFSIAAFIFKVDQGEKTGLIYDLESQAVSPRKSFSVEKSKIWQQWVTWSEMHICDCISTVMSMAVSQRGPCQAKGIRHNSDLSQSTEGTYVAVCLYNALVSCFDLIIFIS